jgi:hypothetical protein
MGDAIHPVDSATRALIIRQRLQHRVDVRLRIELGAQ